MSRRRRDADEGQLVMFEEPKRPTPLEEWRSEIDDWLDTEPEDETRLYMTS